MAEGGGEERGKSIKCQRHLQINPTNSRVTPWASYLHARNVRFWYALRIGVTSLSSFGVAFPAAFSAFSQSRSMELIADRQQYVRMLHTLGSEDYTGNTPKQF